MTTLQRLLFPNTRFTCSETLYLTRNERCKVDYSAEKLLFLPGGNASFESYFNIFSVSFWKTQAALTNIHLVITGTGKFLVSIGSRTVGRQTAWLQSRQITLLEEEYCSVPIEAWESLENGYLFLSIDALSEGSIRTAEILTEDPPLRQPKLGIVITHYNRNQQVRAAVNRIESAFRESPERAANMKLFIVDNSSNLEMKESEFVNVIPSRNFGGSGGFSRGLKTLDEKGFTHCLFMDDDASCEIESLFRAGTIISYTTSPHLTLAGTLFKIHADTIIIESGANFDGYVHSLRRGMNMADRNLLGSIELAPGEANYGGWWFFLFPLSEVRHYPFPFFVRGDDILFGLQNQFLVTTINGIGCWGDDFGFKTGPFTHYLDMRNHLLQRIMMFRNSRTTLIALIVKFVLKALLTYRYATAEAMLLAVRHVLEGPEHFTRSLDIGADIRKINSFTPSESMLPIHDIHGTISEHDIRRPLPRFLRMPSINGFLLPGFLLRQRTLIYPKEKEIYASTLYRRRKVLYYNFLERTGFLAEHRKVRFFQLTCALILVVTRFFLTFGRVRRRFREALPDITRKEFWDAVYHDPDQAGSS